MGAGVSKLPDKEVKVIGDRLREIRLAWGFQLMTEWADYIGLKASAWHNYEHGLRQIPVLEAAKVSAKTGVSFDWLYRGLEGNNPDAVNKRLHRFREMERDHQQLKRA
jgi:transcriptional regulator with XRE-family HTH domain